MSDNNSNSKEKTYTTLLKKAGQSPYLIIPGATALLNGFWYKLKFALMGKKIRIGKAFRLHGKLHVYGAGRVTIGNNCIIDSKLFKTTALFTAFPDSHIKIGNNVGLNGTSIQCFKNVRIDDYCAIADAYIVDSRGHHLSADRRLQPNETLPANPVILRKNVWVSTNVVITRGVIIGENSVIGACSLVNSDIPANSLYAGTPAKLIKTIPDTFSDNQKIRVYNHSTPVKGTND